MALPLSFFERLPKTDLHVHLDGSLRVSTILELAEQDGIELPAKGGDALLKAMNVFAQERDALAVEALLRNGDNDEARQRAERFVEQYPTSPHAHRFRESMGLR